MARIEKTVFISYRRTDVYTALAVYENLKNQDYDVFFDYRSISSGDFEQIITSNIKARAHFILILTPTSLDRLNEPGDWLRREIETAIDEKRNIVPLFFKGFRFGSPSLSEKLTGKLGNISRYNGLNVHEDYFEEAMHRLRTEYLSKPLDTVLHPVSNTIQKIVREEQVAADKALEQIEDVKELVKQTDQKPVQKKKLPKPVTTQSVKSETSSRGSERTIPWRNVAGLVGGLLLMVLLWGGSKLLMNLPSGTPEPTRTSQLVTNAPTSSLQTELASTEPSIPNQSSVETFRVAVVMPSAINDMAFSQSMYDALMRLQEENGGPEKFEIVYSEGMFVVDDAAAAIRDYASQGYDLVIAHGSQYGSSLQEIAPDFPETSFAWGTTVDTFGLPNVFAYEAASQEGGYVNGVLAAALSETKVIGVVGPIETGDAKLYVDGFKAGVAATNPEVQVNVNYIGSFSDVALASEAATTHIAAGADTMTGTAQMVVGAIGRAEENDVLWFGTQSNQTSLAPSIVVASQVYHWEVVLKQMIDLIRGGTRGGQSFTINLANGGEVIEFNPDYVLPEDTEALAEIAIAGIKNGNITIALP